MNELIKNLLSECIPIIITAIGTFLIAEIKRAYNKFVNTETKKRIAELTVKYVEQVFKELHGIDKLEKAKEAAINILAEKGIYISDTEITVMLEAAVQEMNNQSWVTFIEDIKKDGE